MKCFFTSDLGHGPIQLRMIVSNSESNFVHWLKRSSIVTTSGENIEMLSLMMFHENSIMICTSGLLSQTIEKILLAMWSSIYYYRL